MQPVVYEQERRGTGGNFSQGYMPFSQGQISFSQEQKLIPQGLEQNIEVDTLPKKKSICQVPDYLSSPQFLKMNLNAEKEMELIEENLFSQWY